MLSRQLRLVKKNRLGSIGLKSTLFLTVGLALLTTRTASAFANMMTTEEEAVLQVAMETISSQSPLPSILEQGENDVPEMEVIKANKQAKVPEVLENHLTVDPIAPGTQKISGETIPNAVVDIRVDEISQTSVEDLFFADNNGKFSLKLERPITYNQKIEITSSHPKIFTAEEEDEVEGGEAQVVLTTPRHPAAYVIPEAPLKKIENHHQVFVEPLFEGSKKIEGHTSVEGTVYAMIGGTIVSKPAKIQDGYFEVELLDHLAEGYFQSIHDVKLSFISHDGLPVMKEVPVYKLGEGLKSNPQPSFSYTPLVSKHTEFSGIAEPLGRVQLYNAETGEMVTEALVDEEGKYSKPVPGLTSKARFYRVFIGFHNDYQMLVEQTVDGIDKQIDSSNVPKILNRIIFNNTEESSRSLVVPPIHDRKDYIVGQSYYPYHFIRVTSSMLDKKFPTFMTDELGYWGLDFRDLGMALEQGEELKFEVINPKNYKVLATETVTVKGMDDDLAPEDHSLVLPTITSDTGYLTGKTAPYIQIRVHQDGKLLAETHSAGDGKFELDFGDVVFQPRSLLTFTGFDQQGQQILWENILVKKGSGKRIKKVIQKGETDEMKRIDKQQEVLFKNKKVEKGELLPPSVKISERLQEDKEYSLPVEKGNESIEEKRQSAIGSGPKTVSGSGQNNNTLPKTNSSLSLDLILLGLGSIGLISHLKIVRKGFGK